ncbi:MAG: hypothetical protein HQ536_01160 [Parcubacteria group bacterium]|nr:hypothetical protein [Parcubacteria group bacterium]
MKNLQGIIRIFIHLSIIFLLVVYEATFVQVFDHPLSYLDVVLSVIIYLTVVFNLNLALWWSVVAGFLVDLYSLLPFGTTIFALIITAFVIRYLFITFFTNRSLYSLLLVGALGTLVYKIIIFGASFLPFLFDRGYQIFSLDFNVVKAAFLSIVLNLIFLAVIFYLTNLFSKRLKSAYV